MTKPVYQVNGDGPPLVLLHSSMSSRMQWRGLIEQISQNYQCIGIDLYGYGGTPMPENPDSFALMDEVALVETVLSDVGVRQPVTFVGHSYGGAVALAFAEASPERVADLVLFEPVAFSVLNEDDAGWQDLAPTLSAFETTGAEAQSTQLAQAFVEYWNGQGAFAGMPAKRQQQLAGLVDKVRLDFQALLGHSFEPDKLANLPGHVTLLTGRDSRDSARAVVDRLCSFIPHAEKIETEGGHMAPLSHESDVNAHIEQALRRGDG